MGLACLPISGWMSQLKSLRKVHVSFYFMFLFAFSLSLSLFLLSLSPWLYMCMHAHTHLSLYVCVCLPLCVWVSVSLFGHFCASFNCPQDSGLNALIFLSFLILPLDSSPISVTARQSPSFLRVPLIFLSFFHCLPKKSEREKRAPWLSSASLSSLSISPRTWVHITALPHNTLQPEFWGPRVSPKHKGSTPKLLMDLVGPSLFLRKLQCFHWDFPDGSVVKNLPMQETQVQSPGREDPLEKEMATHSSYSCLGTPVARGTRQATDPGISETEQLSINK